MAVAADWSAVAALAAAVRLPKGATEEGRLMCRALMLHRAGPMCVTNHWSCVAHCVVAVSMAC